MTCALYADALYASCDFFRHDVMRACTYMAEYLESAWMLKRERYGRNLVFALRACEMEARMSLPDGGLRLWVPFYRFLTSSAVRASYEKPFGEANCKSG